MRRLRSAPARARTQARVRAPARRGLCGGRSLWLCFLRPSGCLLGGWGSKNFVVSKGTHRLHFAVLAVDVLHVVAQAFALASVGVTRWPVGRLRLGSAWKQP